MGYNSFLPVVMWMLLAHSVFQCAVMRLFLTLCIKNTSLFNLEISVYDFFLYFIVQQNFIVQHLNASFSYFLGLSDPQRNDNWQWIDQTPYILQGKCQVSADSD